MEQNLSSAELVEQRGVVDRKLALMQTLEQYGLITTTDPISDEELQSLVLSKEDLKANHKSLGNDAAIALAYLDHMVQEAKVSGVDLDVIATLLPAELVASLITDKNLSEDGAFVTTVLATVRKNIKESTGNFSDVLFSSLEKRMDEINSVPGVSGFIDESSRRIVSVDEAEAIKKSSIN